MKMFANHLLSEGVGLVPFLGDVFIAWFKPNTRNYWLLEAYICQRRALEVQKVEVTFPIHVKSIISYEEVQ